MSATTLPERILTWRCAEPDRERWAPVCPGQQKGYLSAARAAAGAPLRSLANSRLSAGREACLPPGLFLGHFPTGAQFGKADAGHGFSGGKDAGRTACAAPQFQRLASERAPPVQTPSRPDPGPVCGPSPSAVCSPYHAFTAYPYIQHKYLLLSCRLSTFSPCTGRTAVPAYSENVPH